VFDARLVVLVDDDEDEAEEEVELVDLVEDEAEEVVEVVVVVVVVVRVELEVVEVVVEAWANVAVIVSGPPTTAVVLAAVRSAMDVPPDADDQPANLKPAAGVAEMPTVEVAFSQSAPAGATDPPPGGEATKVTRYWSVYAKTAWLGTAALRTCREDGARAHLWRDPPPWREAGAPRLPTASTQ